MNFEEFLKAEEPEAVAAAESAEPSESVSTEPPPEVEIDIQRAVVESLAADKAEQDEKISALEASNKALQSENLALKARIAEQRVALAKVGDVLAQNAESPLSNQVALLDRAVELPDRFPGETREHVIEALRAARDQAEKEGRLRHAQILEGVLTANPSDGSLAARRAELENLFSENGNIVSGPVIETLEKMGISHKNGEDYLLPSEIINRTY